MINLFLIKRKFTCDTCFKEIVTDEMVLEINNEVVMCRGCIKKLFTFFEDNKTRIISL